MLKKKLSNRIVNTQEKWEVKFLNRGTLQYKDKYENIILASEFASAEVDLIIWKHSIHIKGDLPSQDSNETVYKDRILNRVIQAMKFVNLSVSIEE